MLLFAGVFPWGSSLNGICILLQKCWIVTLLSVFQFSVILHKMKQPPPKTKMKFRWMQQLIIDNFIYLSTLNKRNGCLDKQLSLIFNYLHDDRL